MSLQQKRTRVFVLATCALLAAGGMCAHAQTQSTEQHSSPESRRDEPTETIFLNHVATNYDLNDIQTALRNAFPWAKIYGVQGQNAIVVKDSAEEIQAIKKLVGDLDRPKKVYRVTYSVSDVENGKRTGTQQYSLVVAAGSKTTLKEGKRVPLVTGAAGDNASAASQNAQVQYLDVGVNIEASIDGQGLKTKFEMSAVADEKSGIGAQDPVIQQTMVEGMASLTGGKPVVLGSVEVPGTTHHQEVEVTTELVGQ